MNCKSSIHLEVCLAYELLHQSPAFILLWGVPGGGGVGWLTDPRWITCGKPSDDLAVTYGWSKGDLWVTGWWVSFYRHRRISVRSSVGVPPVAERRTADLHLDACCFFHEFSDGGPWVAERRPAGVRWDAARWVNLLRHPLIAGQILTAS